MTPFDYRRAADQTEALSLAAAGHCRFLGGGTNLVDLMRQNIEAPAALVDVSRLPATIDVTSEGGLIIGAAVRNSAVAAHPVVRAHYPMLSRALLAGASAQIRNMATVGGNLMQRTRCSYFYDAAGSRCNKRDPGAGCDAIDGLSRNHAILGTSEHCIATLPSDMSVAFAALDATVHLDGPMGRRNVRLTDFHQLPGTTPHIETVFAARRADHRNRDIPQRCRSQFALSQGPRSFELRFRAGVRRRGAGCRRRPDQGRTACSGRYRRKAMARFAGRRRPARRGADPGELSARR
jgi:CO/xanthine dehydrogenase FAD-binding subunit